MFSGTTSAAFPALKLYFDPFAKTKNDCWRALAAEGLKKSFENFLKSYCNSTFVSLNSFSHVKLCSLNLTWCILS